MSTHSTNFSDAFHQSTFDMGSQIGGLLDKLQFQVSTKIRSGKISCGTVALPELEESSTTTEPNAPQQKCIEIANKRRYYIETFKQRQKECEKYTKSLQLNQSIILDAIQAKKNKLAAIKEKQEQEILRTREIAQAQRLLEASEERKKKHLVFYQELSKRQEERAKIANQKIPKRNYIYAKLESNYANQCKIQEIEMGKRKKSKRVSLEEIREHQKAYNDLIKERQKKESSRPKASTSLGTYVTVDIEPKHSYENEKKDKLVQFENNKRKARLLQMLYPPKINQKKKDEIIHRISQISCRNQSLKNNSIQPIEQKAWRHNLSKHPKAKPVEMPILKQNKTKDYLHEGGAKKHKKGTVQAHELNKIINDNSITALEKYELSQMQLQRISEKVEQKIENIKASNGYDAKSFEEASDMYINAIQAKLSLLNSFT